MLITEKPWGKEILITVQEKYMVKKLYMNKDARCSLQYHVHKTETVYVLSGLLLLTCDKNTITLSPGDSYTIHAGTIHRMEGLEDTVYLEASTPENDDVVRVEDDYGRE